MSVDKSKVISNLIWKFAERSGAQGVQFIVGIVLARLLTPADYGLIGLITVFIMIANVFVQSGFGQALVQKYTADDLDFSSVFYFSTAISVILYIIIFFAALPIANFYNEPVLIPVLRILSFTLIISGVNSVQQAYVQKTMQFKRFFWATLIGTIVSAIVGVFMAYYGFGVWALVGQQLSNQAVNTIVLWFTVRWRPMLKFSFRRTKNLFSFGWKLLVSALIDTGYNNMYSLIIGKVFTTADLGFYNRGKQYPLLIISNINGAIDSVLFPVLSDVQNDVARLKSMVRRSIKTSTFFIFPAMAGLAAVAEPLVKLMLTDKWLPCVPFIQFSCFIYAFWPIHTANLQAINASGRSDIFLKLEIIKKIIGITIFIVTIKHGLVAMMFGQCCSTIISLFINAAPNRKILCYTYFEQIKDILPSMILSLFMCACVWSLNLFDINIWLLLNLQMIAGIVIYIGGAKLFKFERLDYILNMLKGYKRGK